MYAASPTNSRFDALHTTSKIAPRRTCCVRQLAEATFTSGQRGSKRATVSQCQAARHIAPVLRSVVGPERAAHNTMFDSREAAAIGLGTNCPIPTGSDYDFGVAPNELSVRLPEAHQHEDGHHDEYQDIIGAGQKAASTRPSTSTRVISCGGRRSGPAGHWAVSSGARPPTATAIPSLEAAEQCSGKSLAAKMLSKRSSLGL
jgi:hypothetical protein